MMTNKSVLTIIMAVSVLAAGAKGLIVAGVPTGSPTPPMSEALTATHNAGVPVIMSHRGGLGRVQTNREFISADNLTPQKARILLMLALAAKIPSDKLQQVFLNY